MKRFLLFTFDGYYPSGGWEDFKGAFETVTQAMKEEPSGDYAQIVDLESMEILVTGSREKYDSMTYSWSKK